MAKTETCAVCGAAYEIATEEYEIAFPHTIAQCAPLLGLRIRRLEAALEQVAPGLLEQLNENEEEG